MADGHLHTYEITVEIPSDIVDDFLHKAKFRNQECFKIAESNGVKTITFESQILLTTSELIDEEEIIKKIKGAIISFVCKNIHSRFAPNFSQMFISLFQDAGERKPILEYAYLGSSIPRENTCYSDH